ncbi:MAG: DNA repair protein RecO [Oscillospiraceae bacterium]|nr:DNA repair protein RecO [Oscillospiraceae bacterium]
MQITTTGLVLREIKTGEADRILTVFTQDYGVITAIAKGSMRMKNKLFHATSLFCYSEFILYEGKSMYTVNEASVKEVFFGLRNRVEAVALAMYLAELTSTVSLERTDAKAQLKLLLNAFYFISENKRPLQYIKAVYELRTLSETGYMPDLVACKDCAQYEGGKFYFDLLEGYLLCQSCAIKRGKEPNLDPAALAAMRHIIFVEPAKLYAFTLPNLALMNLYLIVDGYTLNQIDKPLKTRDFLLSVLPNLINEETT